jgi:O-antigen/teichoic acid export membrane protein
MQRPQTHSCPSVRKTLAGAACLSLQPLALNALSVPATAYIIFRLGPDGYGQWTVATGLLTVCGVLSSLGLRGAFVRSVATTQEAPDQVLAEQLGLRLLLTSIAGLLALAACLILGYPAPVVWCTLIGVIGLLTTATATTLADLLQARHQLKTMAGVNLIAGLALIAASMTAAHWRPGPAAIATAYLTGPVVSMVLLAAIVRKRCCRLGVRWNVRRSARLLKASRFFAAQQWLSVGSAYVEILMLPRLVGINQFGFFTAGTLLATRLTALPDGLCTAAYPAMSKACAGRDGARGAAPLVVRLLLIAGLGGALISLVGMAIAEPLGHLLFPGESGAFAPIVMVTIWSLPLVALDSVMGNSLNAAGKDAALARASVPAAALGLGGSLALVLGLGVTGACWSMLLRPAIRAAFLSPLVVRTFRQGADAAVADTTPLPPAAYLRKAG